MRQSVQMMRVVGH